MDIIERLRSGENTTKGSCRLCLEAADEIDRLRRIIAVTSYFLTDAQLLETSEEFKKQGLT